MSVNVGVGVGEGVSVNVGVGVVISVVLRGKGRTVCRVCSADLPPFIAD